VALADVRKEINFCKKVGIPVIGVVENMSGFVCSKCKVNSHASHFCSLVATIPLTHVQTETAIFRPTTGGAEKMANDFGVPFLGRIPLDPQLARACDEGQSYLDRCPDAVGTKAFLAVFNRTSLLARRLDERTPLPYCAKLSPNRNS